MTGQNLVAPDAQFYHTLRRVAQISDLLVETARAQRAERGAPPEAPPRLLAKAPSLNEVVEQVFEVAAWLRRTPPVRPLEGDGGGGSGEGGGSDGGGEGSAGEGGAGDVALVANNYSSPEVLTVQQIQTDDAIGDVGTVTQCFVGSNDDSESDSALSSDTSSDTISSSATPVEAVSGTKAEPPNTDSDRQKDSQTFGSDSKSMFIEPHMSGWNATGLASDNSPHEEPGVRTADDFFGVVSTAIDIGNLNAVAKEAAGIGKGASPVMAHISLGFAVYDAAGEDSLTDAGLAFTKGYVAGYAGEVVAAETALVLAAAAAPPAAVVAAGVAAGIAAGAAVDLGISYAEEIVAAIDKESSALAAEVYRYLDTEIRKLYPQP